MLYLGKRPLIQHQDPSDIHTKIICILFCQIFYIDLDKKHNINIVD